MRTTAAAGEIEAQAWAVLATVPDPEVPVLSLCDLGIVREVTVAPAGGVHVVLTPTYSGCPATEVIAKSVQDALDLAGLGPVTVSHRLAPAWTTDWISEAGRQKLRDDGIAPPGRVTHTVQFRPRNIPCPRCASTDTERLSAFGSTPCKALHRCRACGEPFDHVKPL